MADLQPQARTLDPSALQEALINSGARLLPGLSDAEFDRLSDRYSFQFAPDHRLMLSIALPTDGRARWINWRDDDAQVAERLAWPIEGTLFDVEHNAFWHPEWPTRPPRLRTAIALAREQLSTVPVLAPLVGHRYVPTQPHEAGNPVLSCYQTDIIYYGSDLLDWFDREFHRRSGEWRPMSIDRHLPFWSWFVEDDN